LLFVVTSMLSMSLSLSVQQMTQPLKNARLVILALLANFVLVPLLAYAITKIIPLEESLQIGVELTFPTGGFTLICPRGGIMSLQWSRFRIIDPGRMTFSFLGCGGFFQ